MKDREPVAAALMTYEPDVGGTFQRLLDAAARAARMEESHADRVLQRIVRPRQDRSNQFRPRAATEAAVPFEAEGPLDECQGLLSAHRDPPSRALDPSIGG